MAWMIDSGHVNIATSACLSFVTTTSRELVPMSQTQARSVQRAPGSVLLLSFAATEAGYTLQVAAR